MLCQILAIKLSRLSEASDCCTITAASVAQHFHLCFADGCHRLRSQLLKQVNRTSIVPHMLEDVVAPYPVAWFGN